MRIPKVRITNYRPGPAPAPTGLDHLARIQAGEKNEHDRAVQDYAPETLHAAAADLGKRHYYDRRDPEHRWGMARLGAIARALLNRNLLA